MKELSNEKETAGTGERARVRESSKEEEKAHECG